MRRDDIVVAMADLRNADAEAMHGHGRLMDAHPWLPWLALVLKSTAADTPEVERILRASADFFTAPVDAGTSDRNPDEDRQRLLVGR